MARQERPQGEAAQKAEQKTEQAGRISARTICRRRREGGWKFRKRDPHFNGRKGHAEKKRFGLDDFEYDKATDSYKCPQGNTLAHQCHQKLRNNTGHK
jgi:hypothetical protein